MSKLPKHQAAPQEPRGATAAFILTCGIVVYEPKRVGPAREISHERAEDHPRSQASQPHGARLPSPNGPSQPSERASRLSPRSRCLPSRPPLPRHAACLAHHPLSSSQDL